MGKNNVVKLAGRDTIIDPLTELPRSDAEQLIYQAVEAELLAEHVERRTEDGKAGVVRNGHLPARKLQTGLGPVTFRSALVPPYVRKTKSLEAALAWLYLKGISSGEMGEALKVLVGPDAIGLSAGRVSRLKQVWAEEYRSWCEERLDKRHWVYVWADVYSGQRAEQSRRSCVPWW